MRILITADPIGSVWTFARELSLGLLNKDCAVALVSLGRIPKSAQMEWAADQVSRWGSRFRFAACDAPLEWMENNGRAMAEAEPMVLRVAREFDAELVLSSQFCFGALDCILPRVVVAHSDGLSWTQARGHEPLAESAWLMRYRSLVAEGLRNAAGVTAPTQWILETLGARFELPRQTCVIANGRTIPKTRVHFERNMQAVTTVSHLWDEGANLKMLAQVEMQMPLLVASETGHESSQRSEEYGNAVLLGALDEERRLALYQQSSIYICTSEYESFGLAPLEAALCGCAVLARDIPPLREAWGDAALYFDSAESLSGLLAILAADRRLLNRTCTRARRRAEQFTARQMVNGYVDLFQGILQPAMVGHYVA